MVGGRTRAFRTPERVAKVRPRPAFSGPPALTVDTDSVHACVCLAVWNKAVSLLTKADRILYANRYLATVLSHLERPMKRIPLCELLFNVHLWFRTAGSNPSLTAIQNNPGDIANSSR